MNDDTKLLQQGLNIETVYAKYKEKGKPGMSIVPADTHFRGFSKALRVKRW